MRKSGNQFSMRFGDLFSPMKRIHQYGTAIPEYFRKDLMGNTLLRHIMYRQSRKMNTFVAIVGAVRSGKSYLALRYGELYMKQFKKEFVVKKQCSFTLVPFMRWSQRETNSVYIVDEIQLSMGTREWFDIQHRVFNAFADIQGLRGNLLMIPFPNISYIDKHLRFLMNYVVHIRSQGFCHWYKVVTQHHLGKSWLDYIGSIHYQLPNDKIVNDYEDMKKIFTDAHLSDSLALLEDLDKPREANLSKSHYIKLHKTGTIDDEVFYDRMRSMAFREEDIMAIIESNKIKKIQAKTYPHTCKKCNESWQGRTESPVQCYKCGSRKWK